MGMYKEALEKRALEASDIAWRLGGAAGGGVLGWLIGRIFNRNRKRNWLPWLTALGGMAAGGLATDAAMRFWPKGEGDGKGTEKPADGADGQVDLSARKAEDLEKVIAAYDKAKAWREHNHFKAKAGAGIGGLTGFGLGWADNWPLARWITGKIRAERIKNQWNTASNLARGKSLGTPPQVTGSSRVTYTTPGTEAMGAMEQAKRLSAADLKFIAAADKGGHVSYEPHTGRIVDLAPSTARQILGRLGAVAADTGIGTVVGGTLGAIGDWAGAKYLGNMPNTDISYAQAAKELARRMKQ